MPSGLGAPNWRKTKFSRTKSLTPKKGSEVRTELALHSDKRPTLIFPEVAIEDLASELGGL